MCACVLFMFMYYCFIIMILNIVSFVPIFGNLSSCIKVPGTLLLIPHSRGGVQISE